MEQKERLLMLHLVTLAVLLTDVVLGIGQCGTQFIGFESEVLMVCNQSRTQKQGCTADGEGLTVGELITNYLINAPTCEFINSNVMSMTCLRSSSGREKEYDQVFAQILDAVSGKHEIEHLPKVNLLPMEKDSVTPFIAFKKSCKPVDPDYDVIDICTNRTINYTRVYLMLDREKHADILTEPPVACHCTLQANSVITLQALDVRLQNSSNNQCGASSLEFKSEEKSVELKCQDRPWFGLETLFEGIEISLTLRTDYAPKMVWIEGKADKSPLTTILVSCRTELEFMVNSEMDENPAENNEDGKPMILIIGIAVGCVALIVISFILVIVKCRHQLSKIFRKPRNPRTEYSPIAQSYTADSEQLRAGQDVPNQEIYAELEDVSPTRSVIVVPPPLPSLPPPPSSPTGAKPQTSPSSPTWSGTSVPLPLPPSSPTGEAAPAKPPRGNPASFKHHEKEEYDRIDMTCTGGKREGLGHMQNNNLHSDDHLEDAEGNVYDHLNSMETETSQNPKKQILDNIYAVPDQK